MRILQKNSATSSRPDSSVHPRRRSRTLLVAVASAVLAFGGSAFAASTAGRVDVTLGSPGEYGVTPSVTTVAAGKVTFAVTNKGAITHELNIIRVAGATTILPKGKTAGQRLEKGKIGAVEGVKPGKRGSVTVVLKTGTYQLFCNIPGHYMAGMHTVIRVS